jgi:hypothetical protein
VSNRLRDGEAEITTQASCTKDKHTGESGDRGEGTFRNPVLAFDGYAAVVARKRRARIGLRTAMTTWAHGDIGEGASMEKYRELLFRSGEQCNPGANGQRVEEVMAKKGNLTRGEMLRCRVRYFCDGAVLGTKEFVNGIFEHERHRFGPKRQTGARPMRHVEADLSPF